MRLGKDVLEADLYGDLGVLPDATASELRVAYRRLVRQSHPDLNQRDASAAPRMARLNVAARVLLDPTLRRTYDHARHRASQRPASAKPRRARAWFERDPADHDGDWAEPARVAAEEPRSPLLAGFLAQLRGREGQLSLRIDALIRSLSARQQASVAALLVVVALGLIALARPHSLGGGPPNTHQPTGMNASLLFP